MNFKIEGKNYLINKMNAKKQFHIVRKILPVLKAGEENVDGALKALSDLSEEDSDYCLFGLLNCVQIELEKGIGIASICKNNVLMYDDMSLQTMLVLAAKVLELNFKDFFQSLPSILEEANPKASDQ